jgi:hypothetical protein
MKEQRRDSVSNNREGTLWDSVNNNREGTLWGVERKKDKKKNAISSAVVTSNDAHLHLGPSDSLTRH